MDASQIAIILISGIIFSLLFLILYNMCCISCPIRYMMLFNIAFQVIGKGLTWMLLKGYTFGIPDLVYLVFTDSAFGELYFIFMLVPTAIVYAKMIPNNIEATVFALLTGLNVVANFVVNKIWGNVINTMLIGVTNDNIEDLDKLFAISFFFAFVPLLLIPIVPSMQQVNDSQAVIKFLDEYQLVDHVKQPGATMETLVMAKALDPEYNFDKEIRLLNDVRARECDIYKMVLNDYGVDFDTGNTV